MTNMFPFVSEINRAHLREEKNVKDRLYLFEDEGSMLELDEIQTKKSEVLTIAMFFDDEGKNLLSLQLKKIGIDNTLSQSGIYIRANSRRNFFHYILSDNPIIPNCYHYKFPEWYCYD